MFIRTNNYTKGQETAKKWSVEVETRLLEVETSLVEVETRLLEVETSLVEVETRLLELETSLVEVETRLLELETSLVEVEKTGRGRKYPPVPTPTRYI